jgi:U4/U6 small nuclear ribonucleoprotein PRP31
MDEDVDGDLADLENLNYDDLDSVSKLQKTQRYIDVVQVCYLIVIV